LIFIGSASTIITGIACGWGTW